LISFLRGILLWGNGRFYSIFGAIRFSTLPPGGQNLKHKNRDYTFNNRRNFTKFLWYAHLVRVKKYCERTTDINFIANEHLFKKSKDVNRKIHYRTDDSSGLHLPLSAKGLEELLKTFKDILYPPLEFVSLLKEAKKIKTLKRNRSDISSTPSSAEKQNNKRIEYGIETDASLSASDRRD
jgi:hypothetical protein